MLDAATLENLLFLDIETVSEKASYHELSALGQKLWLVKFTKTEPDCQDIPAAYASHAGIYAEFGKIICISAGYFSSAGVEKKLRIKSFSGDDERLVLQEFLESLAQFQQKRRFLELCGHNIREFDIPYICRRAVIGGLALPQVLRIHGKKPWEVRLLDTMQLWRFGDHRSYVSLSLLAGVLDIPTPKDDLDGSQVGPAYWDEGNLPRIVTYCQKDVVTVAQIVLRFCRLPLLSEQNIEITT